MKEARAGCTAGPLGSIGLGEPLTVAIMAKASQRGKHVLRSFHDTFGESC